MDSPLGDAARRAQMPARLRFLDDTVDALGGELTEPARSRVARLLLVAREYGTLAVVGCGGATRRLSTGQQVTVDGTRGTVTVP